MPKSYCQRCHQPFEVTSNMAGPVVSCPNCKKLTALFFDPEATPLPVARAVDPSSRPRGVYVEPPPATNAKAVAWHPDVKVPMPPAPLPQKPKLVVQPVETPRAFALPEVAVIAQDLVANIEKVIVGKHSQIMLAVVALMAEGHILVEDFPGLAKTVFARAMAVSAGFTLKRIQCTPDFQPTDVLGENFLNPQTGRLEPRFGSTFPQLILVDEINRASPRTLAALLEAMGESLVTVDQATFRLLGPFMVIATRNSLGQEGSVPLSETQRDRFLLRLALGYPDLSGEKQMLERFQMGHPIDGLTAVATPERITECQHAVRAVRVGSGVADYILAVSRATREHPALALGASPRATLALFRMAQAQAAVAGRDHVTAADVRDLAPIVLGHRLVVRADAKFASVNVGDVIQEIIAQTPVPAEGL